LKGQESFCKGARAGALKFPQLIENIEYFGGIARPEWVGA
jgi:hypothetical protein